MVAAVKIPKRVQERLIAGLKKYQRIVGGLRERDISEADTVTVVKDMLTDIFGYDKYTELTSEQQIRGTFCDLAIKVEGKIYYLAEVKAAGINLNNTHLRQAVNYGAHQGIEWIILTNAIEWKIYRLKFGQPIDFEEVFSLDICALSTRSLDDVAKLFLLCRENVSSDALTAFHQQAQIVNRYVIAELLRSTAVAGCVRKELKRLFDVKVTDEQVAMIIGSDVLKRDVVDGDQPAAAAALVKKTERSIERKKVRAAAIDTPT